MTSERVNSAIRRVVSTRAKNCCEYCRSSAEFAIDSFTIDHINPRQAGGETTVDNLAWACFGCNSHKQARTRGTDPETDREVAFYNPRQQVWTEHFAWSDDFTEVIGKTACGRVTINALHLNRRGVVNLRRLLVRDGLHPPEEV